MFILVPKGCRPSKRPDPEVITEVKRLLGLNATKWRAIIVANLSCATSTAALHFGQVKLLALAFGILTGIMIVTLLPTARMLSIYGKVARIPDELLLLPGIKEWLRELPLRIILIDLGNVILIFCTVFWVYIQGNIRSVSDIIPLSALFLFGCLIAIISAFISARNKNKMPKAHMAY